MAIKGEKREEEKNKYPPHLFDLNLYPCLETIFINSLGESSYVGRVDYLFF